MARPLPSLPVTVHSAGTSTVRSPAGISAYSVVWKYTDPLEEILVPAGIGVASVLVADAVKRIVVVAALAGSRVTPFSRARLSRNSE